MFYVLGVSHTMQGETTVPGHFEDPDYATLVTNIISSTGVDFVGEEGGNDTTFAEKITNDLLGPGHYLNVEQQDRYQHDIGTTYDGYKLPSASGGQFDVVRWFVSENEKREKIWVDHLVARTDRTGCLICGFYHAFSVAAKLFDRGFEVESRTYLPHDKLARSRHKKEDPGTPVRWFRLRKLAREAVIFMLTGFLLGIIYGSWNVYHGFRVREENVSAYPYDPGQLLNVPGDAADKNGIAVSEDSNHSYRFRWKDRCYEWGGRPVCPEKIPWEEMVGFGFLLGLFGFPAGLAVWVFCRLVVFAIKG